MIAIFSVKFGFLSFLFVYLLYTFGCVYDEIYIYVCVCVCIYIHIYMYLFIYIHMIIMHSAFVLSHHE